MARDHYYERGARHESQAADKDQPEYDGLPETGPRLCGVDHDQAGYCHRRDASEERLGEGRKAAFHICNGQDKQGCSQYYQPKKAVHQQHGGRGAAH